MDRKIEKKKWPLRKIIWFSLAGSFIIIVTYSLLFGDHSSKYKVNLERITISTVYEGPFQEFIPVTGVVKRVDHGWRSDFAENGKDLERTIWMKSTASSTLISLKNLHGG